ncbi:MAG: hypothetical protein AAF806_28265 [Bacteroidota bacterium]
MSVRIVTFFALSDSKIAAFNFDNLLFYHYFKIKWTGQNCDALSAKRGSKSSRNGEFGSENIYS